MLCDRLDCDRLDGWYLANSLVEVCLAQPIKFGQSSPHLLAHISEANSPLLATYCSLFFFSLVSLLGGTGVPPGTKPETCKRCKGSGVVSTSLLIFILYFRPHACFFVYNVCSFYLVFSPLQSISQTGPFTLQTTCPSCKGTGKIVSVWHLV